MTADAHVRFSGYRDSPLAGGPYAPIEAVRAALRAHEVDEVRVIGIPSEYAAGASARGEVISERGGPWLDGQPDGFRATRVCSSEDGVRRSVDAAVLDQFNWLPIGRSLSTNLANLAIDLARENGIQSLVEGRPDIESLNLAHVGSVDGLASLGVPHDVDANLRLLYLAEHSEALQSNLLVLARAEVPLVPLLVSLRRHHILDEVIAASGLDHLCEILPYHKRLLEMRNPAAYRFGKKHAERYLGMRRLSPAERDGVGRGWAIVVDLLNQFAEGGGVLALGGGSPDTGLCPGFATADELRLWSACGLSEAVPGASSAARSLSGPWMTSGEGTAR